jgi:hypothetical protein
MRPLPQVVRNWTGIDACCVPPSHFVAAAVNLAVVSAAERDGELIADFTAERTALRESQVVSIARLPAADQARLLGDEPHVLAIADAPRLGEGKHGLVDGARSFGPWTF